MNPGAVLAQIRWNKPEEVERRVDALAETIRQRVAAMPRLTAAQQGRLLAAVRQEVDTDE